LGLYARALAPANINAPPSAVLKCGIALFDEGPDAFARFGRTTSLHVMFQCQLKIMFHRG